VHLAPDKQKLYKLFYLNLLKQKLSFQYNRVDLHLIHKLPENPDDLPLHNPLRSVHLNIRKIPEQIGFFQKNQEHNLTPLQVQLAV